MSLWWLQPGWDQATCGHCGSRIAPEGDPDWGLCWPCMQQDQAQQADMQRAEDAFFEHLNREAGL